MIHGYSYLTSKGVESIRIALEIRASIGKLKFLVDELEKLVHIECAVGEYEPRPSESKVSIEVAWESYLSTTDHLDKVFTMLENNHGIELPSGSDDGK